MAYLTLPKPATHDKLLYAMQKCGVLDSEWDHLDLKVSYDCFVTASALALLSSWGAAQRDNGKTLRIHGDSTSMDYMSRMGLLEQWGVHYTEHFNRHSETGRFLPIMTVNDEDSVYLATNSICEIVLNQFDNARDFLPAMEWCVNEVIDNVRLHSDSKTPGSVCAQFYPLKNRLDIAIVDHGRGIKSSLGERLELTSHKDAISHSLKRGMTRNPDVGQGNGLTGTLEIVEHNDGILDIWTGDAELQVNGEKRKRYISIPYFTGTGVFLQLKTDVPVSIEDTFIGRTVGDSGWSYINVVSENIEHQGGIFINQECIHTGGREPAIRLRRKIEAILPEMNEALVLDFSGVETTSSSFLDELLGRLASSLEPDGFREKIILKNISPTLESMANVVIHQRLHN